MSGGRSCRDRLRRRRFSGLSNNAGRPGLLRGVVFEVHGFRAVGLFLGQGDGFLLQGHHVMVILSEASHLRRVRVGLQGEALRQQGVVGFVQVLQVEICLAFLGLRAEVGWPARSK